MIGSTLAGERVPAHENNFNVGRFGEKIQKITVHHMASRLTAHRCGELFQNPSRGASSHYGIGFEGEIAQYVGEENTAWTDSDRASNRTSVTIECANASTGELWKVSDKTFDSLVRLVADIALRNGLGLLVKGINLTWHRMYSATACPGTYLLSRMDDVVKGANKILSGAAVLRPVECIYRVNITRWLPDVTGHSTRDTKNGYAGNLGEPICLFQANASEGNLYYRVHQKGGAWLPQVQNRSDFAGNPGKEIDGVMIRSDVTTLHYQVHTRERGWLPPVSGYDTGDAKNGYAGNFGQSIDAILLWADPICDPPTPEVGPAPEVAPTPEEVPIPEEVPNGSFVEKAILFLKKILKALLRLLGE